MSLTKYRRTNHAKRCLLTLILFSTAVLINTIVAQTRKLTTSEIVRQVEHQFRGKIVSVRYQQPTNRYVVKLLQRDGKVHHLIIDAITGKQIKAINALNGQS